MTTYGSDPTSTGTGLGSSDNGSTWTGTGDTTSDASTTDKAKETASTATDQGRQVAGTAKDEALNVAGTAADQARSVINDAKQQVTTQLNDQATTQRDQLSQTLRTLGDDLQQMANGQGPASGLAADLAQEVSDRVRALGSHLEGREPGQLLDDARDFARRRPGTFLLGAVAAGVVAGRLFRATADGAAAASLAESGDSTGTLYGGTTAGTGTMGKVSGAAPLTNAPTTPPSTYSPGAGGYDPAVSHPTHTTPASTDPTTAEIPGQRTQGTP
jgi:hypothetical protein